MLWRVDARYFYRDFDHEHDRDVAQPPAACLAVRADAWRALGGFDERLWLYWNDVDLCRRLLATGARIRYLAAAEVMHHEGASTARFAERVPVWARDRIAYYRKHWGLLGTALVRVMLRVRGLVEWWRLGRRHRDPAEQTGRARRAAGRAGCGPGGRPRPAWRPER
ncbi:MAG: glycosyltransferase [Planctomycetota bacterium]